MKRYNLSADFLITENIVMKHIQATESETGEWVRFQDVEADKKAESQLPSVDEIATAMASVEQGLAVSDCYDMARAVLELLHNR